MVAGELHWRSRSRPGKCGAPSSIPPRRYAVEVLPRSSIALAERAKATWRLKRRSKGEQEALT